MNVEDIARVAHEANREYCRTLGDFSQIEWFGAPAWQRDSAINGVKFHLNNPDTTPEDSHVNWLKQKEAEGWAYGPTKDVERKLHPCFLPYDQLPVEQRQKDHIFRAVVHSFLPLYSGEIQGL